MPVLLLSRQAFLADVPSAILDFLFYQICSSPVTNRLEFVFLLRETDDTRQKYFICDKERVQARI
jgi:hypothetical protein